MKQSRGGSHGRQSSGRGGSHRRGSSGRGRGEKPSVGTLARMRAGTSEPEYAESIGDSLDSAIRQAVDILGAREDEVDVEVLEEGKRGFLWFSPKRPFRVRVTWQADQTHEEIIDAGASASHAERRERPAPGRGSVPSRSQDRPERAARREEATPRRTTPDDRLERGPAAASAPDEAEDFVSGVFSRVGIDVELSAKDDESGVRLRVGGESAEEFLAERDGEVQSALQVLTHRVLSRRAERSVPVTIDVGAAGQDHESNLRDMAKRLAEEVMASATATDTELLSSPDRRIVHRTLADHPSVTTESQGRGLMKRVRIAPR